MANAHAERIRSVFIELRRRRVFQAAGVYIVRRLRHAPGREHPRPGAASARLDDGAKKRDVSLREIGIRAALGAHPRRLLWDIFSRAALQLAGGLVLGVVAASLLELATEGGFMSGRGAIMLPAL